VAEGARGNFVVVLENQLVEDKEEVKTSDIVNFAEVLFSEQKKIKMTKMKTAMKTIKNYEPKSKKPFKKSKPN
jgi:hypothetical protein